MKIRNMSGIELTVALLAYKEADNLRVLIPQIKENVEKIVMDYEIIVVDTEEPLDETSEVCDFFGIRYVNQRSPGFGGAFRTAVEEAEGKMFLILDSDGSHNPMYIPQMIKKFQDGCADVVIGSRYVKGGNTNDKTLSVVMSHILNLAYRISLGISAKDISTDFRIYRTTDLKGIQLKCVNYDVLQEVLVKIEKYKNRKLIYEEIPISFEKRLYGESKRRLIPFIVSYIRTLVYLVGYRAFGER